MMPKLKTREERITEKKVKGELVTVKEPRI